MGKKVALRWWVVPAACQHLSAALMYLFNPQNSSLWGGWYYPNLGNDGCSDTDKFGNIWQCPDRSLAYTKDVLHFMAQMDIFDCGPKFRGEESLRRALSSWLKQHHSWCWSFHLWYSVLLDLCRWKLIRNSGSVLSRIEHLCQSFKLSRVLCRLTAARPEFGNVPFPLFAKHFLSIPSEIR